MQDEYFSVLILIITSISMLYYILPKNGDREFYKDFSNYNFCLNVADEDLIMEIFTSSNENEIMIYRIILDAHNINYYIINSIFHHLYPGPYIWGYNVARFYIKRSDYKSAFELLVDYKISTSNLKPQTRTKVKIRNIFEALVLGWIIHEKEFKGNTYLAKHKYK
ncbi:MAG: hypothetical protein EPN93_15100 [Spirochaetes bacterium]|nr:MAG: hypothetical protein EPN93_15100 [Spirochaetota bacterium]